MTKLSPGIHYPSIKGVKRKVKVMASGKWKFMKMPGGRGKKRTGTKSRRSSNPRKGTKKMAKRKRSRRSRSLTIPIAVVAPVAATLVDSYRVGGDVWGMLDQLCQRYFGISVVGFGWQPGRLSQGLLPLILGTMVHKYVGGRPFNVNGMLARANVPFIRL